MQRTFSCHVGVFKRYSRVLKKYCKGTLAMRDGPVQLEHARAESLHHKNGPVLGMDPTPSIHNGDSCK